MAASSVLRICSAKFAVPRSRNNADRVYVTGCSSGAMMTELLLGLYPDIFAASAHQQLNEPPSYISLARSDESSLAGDRLCHCYIAPGDGEGVPVRVESTHPALRPRHAHHFRHGLSGSN